VAAYRWVSRQLGVVMRSCHSLNIAEVL
jgi:hypothetical protein